jgi:hypothetical protein
MPPSEKDQPGLEIRTQQIRNNRGDQQRKAGRNEIRRISESAFKTVKLDVIGLYHRVKKNRVRRDHEPKLPTVLVF